MIIDADAGHRRKTLYNGWALRRHTVGGVAVSKALYQSDFYRHFGGHATLRNKILPPPELKYTYYLRMASSCGNKLLNIYYRLQLKRLSGKTLIQIPHSTKIGKGFYIGHVGRVIINSKAVIGDNVNIATGVTIGLENRGKRRGCPTIGNCVWIGTNAVIVGNIKIGDDVLIAPLTFVNFDVPSHSIVMGNPAKIIPRDHATEGYIDRAV